MPFSCVKLPESVKLLQGDTDIRSSLLNSSIFQEINSATNLGRGGFIEVNRLDFHIPSRTRRSVHDADFTDSRYSV